MLPSTRPWVDSKCATAPNACSQSDETPRSLFTMAKSSACEGHVKEAVISEADT